MRREERKQMRKKLTVFNRVLVMFLIVALVLSNLSIGSMEASAETGSEVSTTDTWDGEVDTAWYDSANPQTSYTIDTAAQLAGLASLVNADKVTFSGVTITLTTDIELASIEWTAIGEEYNRFCGVFDGGDYTISGLYINNTDSDYQGLFGYVDNAEIKNITVDGTVTGYSYTAGVVGRASSSTITGCTNLGDITGYSYTAGVVGRASSSTITGCTNLGDITGNSSYTAGVVGRADGNTVTDCSNEGNIIGTGYVGGIAGYSYSSTTISECYNTGKIEGSYLYVGGIVGYNYSTATVSYCYNTGDVESTSTYVGGIVGYNYYTATVSYCYNTGDVESTSYYVGGIVGRNYGTSSTPSIVSNCYNVASVKGSYNVGGVVGNNDSNSTTEYSYSAGSVTGGSSTGGAIGANSGTVTKVYYDSDLASGETTLVDITGVTALKSAEMTGSSALTNMELNYSDDSQATWKVNSDGLEGEDTICYYPVLTSNEQTSDLVYYNTARVETVFDEFFKGLGTEEDPFQIEDADDLDKLAELVNAGNSTKDLYFEQTDNITLSSDYALIGYYTNGDNCSGFAGYYNGNGNTISGEISKSGSGNVGIFSYTDGATITNLATDVDIIASDNVGGIVGYAKNTTISYCYNTGDITAYAYVGGIVGDANGTTISCCYNTGDITSATGGHVAGISGTAQYSSVIINCYNTGTISAKYYGLAGIVSYIAAGATITNCYSIGDLVNLGTSTDILIGGVVAKHYSGTLTITNCYYNADNIISSNITSTADTSTALTAEEMSDKDKMSGFEDEVWNFTEKSVNDTVTTYTYPTLIGNTQDPAPYYSVKVLSLSNAFADGDGSEESPYQISSLEELNNLATLVNSGVSTSGLYFIQTEDIVLGEDYTPIGISNTVGYFAGTYNGNDCEISGTIGDGTSDYQGVFGYVMDATITNLNVSVNVSGVDYIGGVVGYAYNTTITSCSSTGDINGEDYIGGIVGYASKLSITNCYNTGDVNGTENYIGGVAGYASETSVTNCYNTGDVTAIGNMLFCVGGVVGKVTSESITNCYNTGNVVANGETMICYVGGVVGQIDSTTASNCYSTGDVSYNNNITYMGIGGVVGASSSSNDVVSYCYYNSDNITSTLNSTKDGTDLTTDEMTGENGLTNMELDADIWSVKETETSDDGLTTYYYYPTLISNTQDPAPTQSVDLEFDNAFASGDGTEEYPYEISSLEELNNLATLVNVGKDTSDLYFIQTADIEITGDYSPIGNSLTYYFAGNYDGDGNTISGIIDNSADDYVGVFGHAKGATITDLTTDITVNGNRRVGGVVGYAVSSEITNCHNIGDVSATGNYVGGVVGDVTTSSDYTNGVTIQNCSNTGAISGLSHVGGIVGEVFAQTGSKTITIEQCYNAGDLTGTNSSDSYIGGVAGYVTVTSAGYNTNVVITQCYNTATLTASNSTDKWTALGGIVGFTGASQTSATLTISECYSVGDMVASITEYIGGTIGRADIIGTLTVESCYYNSDIYTGTSTSYGTALTTTQIAGISNSLTGFDSDSWTFGYVINDEKVTYYYPVLVSNTQDPVEAYTEAYTDIFGLYFDGSGTEEDPYEISSLTDLNNLAELVNEGSDGYNIYFEQTEDIEITGDYTPISYYTSSSDYKEFAGNYDGNSKTISGTISNGADSYVAVFGYTRGATITNLATDISVTGRMQVGGIVGYAHSTTITNCYNTGNITGYMYVGGIAGSLIESTITNCYNTGNITATGGIVAGITARASYDSKIENCYNAGTITNSSSDNYIGGIVSYATNSITIVNCYNIGNIIMENPATTAIRGGILGKLSSGTATVTNCYYNVDNITGSTLNSTNDGTGLTTAAMTGLTTDDDYAMIFSSDSTGTTEDYSAWVFTADADAVDGDTTTTTYTYPVLESNEQDPAPSVDVETYYYTVTITLGDGMTSTSTTTQRVEVGTEIEDIVITANSGYGFITGYLGESAIFMTGEYSMTMNGITITRNSSSQITISGTPTVSFTKTLDSILEQVNAETPTITNALETATYEYGATVETLLNGTATTTDSGTITYQWYSSSNGTDWSVISDVTSATYTPSTSILGTTYYKVEVTNEIDDNGDGGTKTATKTDTVAITVVPQIPSINTDLSETAVTYTYGTTANTLTIEAAISAGTLSYQWYSSSDNTTWSAISGATNASYTPATDAVATTYYKCVVTNTATNEDDETEYTSTVDSKVATITVEKATAIVTDPIAKTDLTYTGGTQELISGGSTIGGTLYYSTDGTTYATTIPTATDAGTYKVYYKVDGGDNYNNVDTTYIEATIAKATPTVIISAAKVSQNALATALSTILGTYEDQYEITVTVTGVNSEAPTGTATIMNGTTAIVSDLTVTEGTATYSWTAVTADAYTLSAVFTAEADTNYTDKTSDSVDYTISKADQEVVIEKVENVTYGDDDFTLSVSGTKESAGLTYEVTSGTAVSVDSTGEVTIDSAGEVTIKVTAAETTNYNSDSETVTFTVAQKELDNDDVDITGVEESYIFTNSAFTPTPVVTYGTIGLVAGTDYEVSYSNNIAISTDETNATVIITFKGNYTGTATATFDVVYGTATSEMISYTSANDNGWYTDDITISAVANYEISTSPTSDFGSSITISTEGEAADQIYYMKDSDGKIYVGTFTYNLDKTAPTAEIEIETSLIKKVINTITFGMFFKETVTVTITGSDNLIDDLTVEYQKVTSGSSYEAGNNWTAGNSFSVNPNETFTVYARVTDEAGNVTTVNSTSITIYTDSTPETASFEFVKSGEDTSKSVEVALNGNTIKSITIGERTVDADDYTVSQEVDGVTTITFLNTYLDDFDGGPYTFTINYNPLGETYEDGEGNEAPTSTTVTAKIYEVITDMTDTTETSNISVYTGEAQSSTIASGDAGLEKVTVKYSGDEGATYTLDTRPSFTDAGTYTIYYELSADNYKTVYGEIEFTIAKADPTVTISAAKDSTNIIAMAIGTILGTYEDQYTITATVTGTANGDTPTGTVTIMNGETAIASDLEVKDGVATYAWTEVTADDYTLTAEFTAEANTNYKDETSGDPVSYTISKADQDISITDVDTITYGDNDFTLSVSGTKESASLRYEVTGSAVSVDSDGKVKILSAGEVTIKVTAAETTNYNSDSETITFEVEQKDITDSDFTFSFDNLVYTGSAITPVSSDLVAGTDYTIEYNDNINAGTATVTITGTGNYSSDSTIEKTFTIAAIQLTVIGTEVADKTYDGTTAVVTTDISIGTVSGVVDNESTGLTATATFADKNAGEDKEVEVVYSVTNTNYVAPEEETVTADIEAKQLTISGTTVDNKTYDGGTIASVTMGTLADYVDGETVEVKVEATFSDKNVGTYKTVTVVYFITDTNYIAPVTETLNADITAKGITVTPDSAQGKYYGETDGTLTYDYTGNLEGVTFSGTLSRESGEALGDYDITIGILKVDDTNYYVTLDETTVTYEIRKYEPSDVVTAVTAWTNTAELIITAPSGYTISSSDDLTEDTWESEITITATEGEDCSYTYYLKDNTIGAISAEKTFTYDNDQTVPTGEITINSNSFKEFINTISFNMFFKNTVDVAITGSDELSRVASVEYQKVATEDDYNVDGEWIEDDSFSVTANDQFVVYARITDNAGNVTIINSDGVTVYTDSAVDTESISFTKLSTTDVTADVETNGNTILAITNGNDTLIASTDYTVSEESNNITTITFKASYLDTLSSGDYTFTISYNPMGETYVVIAGNEAPTDTEITLTVSPKSVADFDVELSSYTKVYDGSTLEPTVTVYDGTTEISSDYYKITYSEEVTVGTKVVSIEFSEPYTGTFTEDVTITNASITPSVTAVQSTTYDSGEQSPTAPTGTTVNSQTLTVKYQDEDGDYTLTDMPSYETSGIYTVYYELSADNHKTVYGSIEFTINKIQLTWNTDSTVKDKVYDGTTTATVDTAPTLVGVITGDTAPAITVGTVTFASEDVGTHTVTATGYVVADDTNYIAPTSQPTFANASITAKEITVTPVSDQGKYYGETDGSLTYDYTGNLESVSFTGTLSRESGEALGDYDITIGSLDVDDDNYYVTFVDTVTYEIKEYEPDASVTALTDWTYTAELTLKAPSGYTISSSDDLTGNTWVSEITITATEGEDSTYTYYLKDNTIGAISAEKTFTYDNDQTVPTGEITINSNSFKEFINTISFNMFFKNTVDVAITGSDELSGVASVEYQKVATEDDYNVDGEWIEDDSFSVTANEQFVVYARITDKAGNVTIINSDGVTVYTDSAVDTESISFTKLSTDNATADVTTNGNTILAIKNDEYTLTSSDYSVSAESDNTTTITFKASYLDTLSSGSYTFTISYNPLGETYVDATDDSVAPTDTTIALKVSPKSVADFDVKLSSYTKVYDGTVLEPTVTVYDGTTEISSDYYIVTYSDEVTVGTKVVSITFSEPYTGTLKENVTITKTNQVIEITEVAAKTYGDDTFTLAITGQNDTSTVTYSVADDNGVVEIAGNTVTIIGAGTVTITATVDGDNNYNGDSATYDLTVAQKALSVTIDNQEIVRGMSIPTFTSNVSGNVNGDVITVAYSTITDNMTAGDYTITMTNTSDYANYDITVTSGTLTITDGYTVSFDDTEVTDIAYGATVSQPTDPTKDGYIFRGWYLGDSEFDFTTAITGDLALTSVWEEAVEKEIETTGSAEVTIEAEVEEQLLDELFTEEEIALNVEMKVTVQIDVVEVTDMDESAQEEFTSYLEEYQANSAESETVTQAIIFDISVVKSLAGVDETITVLETPIRITIEIPEEYQSDSREFFILRNHDGEITILEDLDDDSTTITIETDRFSNYTLNYVETVDVEVELDEEDEIEDDIDAEVDTEVPDAEVSDTTVPDTGDSSSSQMSIILMFTSLLGILVISKKKLLK